MALGELCEGHRGPRLLWAPGSVNLSITRPTDGHPWLDLTSAFRQEEQEAARRQGGDSVWNQSFPWCRHTATCDSLVRLIT